MPTFILACAIIKIKMKELVPINDCVVVELMEQFANIAIPDKQYATRTQGVVCATSDHDELLGKTVYFEEFKDGCQVELNGQKFAFIKYEDIRGVYEQAK